MVQPFEQIINGGSMSQWDRLLDECEQGRETQESWDQQVEHAMQTASDKAHERRVKQFWADQEEKKRKAEARAKAK